MENIRPPTANNNLIKKNELIMFKYTYIHNIRPDDSWIWTRKVSCCSHEDIAVAGHQRRYIGVWIEGTFTNALIVFDDCQILHLRQKDKENWLVCSLVIGIRNLVHTHTAGELQKSRQNIMTLKDKLIDSSFISYLPSQNERKLWTTAMHHAK